MDERYRRSDPGFGGEWQRERGEWRREQAEDDDRAGSSWRRDDARWQGSGARREGQSSVNRGGTDYDYDYRQNRNYGYGQGRAQDYGYERSYGADLYPRYPRYGQGPDIEQGRYGGYRGEEDRGIYRAQVYDSDRDRYRQDLERYARSDWDDSRVGISSYERPSGQRGYGTRNFVRGEARETRRGFIGLGPKGYTRSDERIREDVCERLSMDDEVDASEIMVTVQNREVTLEGTVENRHMKHLAEDLAESVSGVEDVHNRISVNKTLLREIADKVTGSETPQHHAYSGTKSPMTSGQSNIENGRRHS